MIVRLKKDSSKLVLIGSPSVNTHFFVRHFKCWDFSSLKIFYFYCRSEPSPGGSREWNIKISPRVWKHLLVSFGNITWPSNETNSGFSRMLIYNNTGQWRQPFFNTEILYWPQTELYDTSAPIAKLSGYLFISQNFILTRCRYKDRPSAIDLTPWNWSR